MAGTSNKPEGTEKHPPNVDPGRGTAPEADEERQKREPLSEEPRPEAGAGEQGVPQPKR
jgi:hypothetical protein